MNKKVLLFIVSMIFLICAGAIAFFTLGGTSLLNTQKNQEQRRARLFIPGETDTELLSQTPAERMAFNENLNARVPMGEGEVIISILNQDFSGNAVEEQFIAYRSLLEHESPVYAAFIEYDEKSRNYRRVWNIPTVATQPGTVSLYSMDLIGDRNTCIILSGMNSQGEHTMTIFMWNNQKNQRQDTRGNQPDSRPPFIKIAEIQIEGSISVQEIERTQAYQLGIANGQSYTIAAYGHDTESANILDQVEIIYTHNPRTGIYERTKITRVPGSQVEQRRLRELLSGSPGVFENFIHDLWYYVGPQGILDSRQYIYFDPVNHELIFFGDETQQVFNWQNSTPTRYGLYISSQNISITTLRRFLDIELESLDSIRVKVFEDVRLKIGVSASWDGSYRRAGNVLKTAETTENTIRPYIDAVYDSSMGRLRLSPEGIYELNSGNSRKKGWYVLFRVNNQDFLEMQPDTGNNNHGAKNEDDNSRIVYRIDKSQKTDSWNPSENLNLTKVRLGTTGVLDLQEGTITLTPAEG